METVGGGGRYGDSGGRGEVRRQWGEGGGMETVGGGGGTETVGGGGRYGDSGGRGEVWRQWGEGVGMETVTIGRQRNENAFLFFLFFYFILKLNLFDLDEMDLCVKSLMNCE